MLSASARSLLSVITTVMTQEIDRLTKRVLDEVRIEPTLAAAGDRAGCRTIHRPARSSPQSTGRTGFADRATSAPISA